MNAVTEVKGWCPGILRPMASGDGLIVRVRPRGGAFSLETAAALADLAQRLGNGHIDLTRRANLQLRGLIEDRLPELRTELATLGLLDPDTETEAVRNVMHELPAERLQAIATESEKATEPAFPEVARRLSVDLVACTVMDLDRVAGQVLTPS